MIRGLGQVNLKKDTNLVFTNRASVNMCKSMHVECMERKPDYWFWGTLHFVLPLIANC